MTGYGQQSLRFPIKLSHIPSIINPLWFGLEFAHLARLPWFLWILGWKSTKITTYEKFLKGNLEPGISGIENRFFSRTWPSLQGLRCSGLVPGLFSWFHLITRMASLLPRFEPHGLFLPSKLFWRQGPVLSLIKIWRPFGAPEGPFSRSGQKFQSRICVHYRKFS